MDAPLKLTQERALRYANGNFIVPFEGSIQGAKLLRLEVGEGVLVLE
jgi:hypothetical protein